MSLYTLHFAVEDQLIMCVIPLSCRDWWFIAAPVYFNLLIETKGESIQNDICHDNY